MLYKKFPILFTIFIGLGNCLTMHNEKTSIGLLASVLLLIFGLHHTIYGNDLKDIFEENTEQKSNPYSTFFITPRAVKQNYRTYQPWNRSIIKMDQFTPAEQHDHNFQNLGNHGTAAQPIFYVLPQQIGAQYGLNAYDVYFKHPLDIYYYRPYNSYTYFNIILANLGSFIFDGCYSQRLDKPKNCYIGFNIRNSMTEQEWPTKNDVKIVSAMPHIDVWTHIYSSNELYHLFLSFSSMPYHTREFGGIRLNQDQFDFSNPNTKTYQTSIQDLLNEAYMSNTLTHGILHKQNRRNLSVYHHYEFTKPLQLYHEATYEYINHILDINSQDLSSYLMTLINCNPEQNPEHLISKLQLKSLNNELGIKGNIDQNHCFYNIYYQLKNNVFRYNFPNIGPPSKTSVPKIQHATEQGKKQENEHYIGFHTRFNIAKKLTHQFHIDGQYLFANFDYNFHQFQAAYQNNFIKFTYNSVKYKVPYIVQYGFSSLRKWHEQFKQPSAQQVTTKIYCPLPGIELIPQITYQKLYNHIFYTKNNPLTNNHCIAKPQQSTTPNSLLLYGGTLNFCFFSCIHLDNHIVFFKDMSHQIHKIFQDHLPYYMYTGRYFYLYQPLNKNTELEIGFNVHFKDHYYADGYDIVSQQFYKQSQFIVQGRIIMDFFINWQISHVKLSVKYSYFNADFYKTSGYFITPFYPALKQAADVSVNWSFFD